MTSHDCQPLNILLIESNELDANLTQRLLIHISQGLWTSTHVSSLEDGIQVYQVYQELHPDHQTFDLVIMTLPLPGSQGLDAIRKFSVIYPKAKLLILTALSHKSLKREALDLGDLEILQFFIKEETSMQQMKEALQIIQNGVNEASPQSTLER